jgi:hypothetical protein
MRPNSQLFELSFNRLAHAVITVLCAENAGLQSYLMTASTLVQDVTKAWPLLKHFFGGATSHAAFFAKQYY